MRKSLLFFSFFCLFGCIASIENPFITGTSLIRELSTDEKNRLIDLSKNTWQATFACKVYAIQEALKTKIPQDPLGICTTTYSSCIDSAGQFSFNINQFTCIGNANVQDWSNCMLENKAFYESLEVLVRAYSCEQLPALDSSVAKQIQKELPFCEQFKKKCSKEE